MYIPSQSNPKQTTLAIQIQIKQCKDHVHSYLDGVLPLGEVDLLLPLLLRLLVGLVLGHAAAHSTGVPGAEVEREVLLVLVEQAELGALVEVDDGENASDRLANVVAVGEEKYISFLFDRVVFLCGFALFLFLFLMVIQIRFLAVRFPSLFLVSYCVGGRTGRGSQRTFSGSSRRHRQRSSEHGAGSIRPSTLPTGW